MCSVEYSDAIASRNDREVTTCVTVSDAASALRRQVSAHSTTGQHANVTRAADRRHAVRGFRHPRAPMPRRRVWRAVCSGLSWLQRDADEKRHARKSRTPQGCGIGRAMRDSNDPSSHAFTRRARASCRSRLRPPPSPGMTRAPAPTLPDLLRLRSDPVQAARCRRTRGRAAGRRRGQPRPPV